MCTLLCTSCFLCQHIGLFLQVPIFLYPTCPQHCFPWHCPCKLDTLHHVYSCFLKNREGWGWGAKDGEQGVRGGRRDEGVEGGGGMWAVGG